MKYNNLMQAYANSPDDHANGYATFTLCTDGTLTADANVWGGRMNLKRAAEVLPLLSLLTLHS